MYRSFRTVLGVAILIATVPCAQAQEDKVYRALSPEATEKLLQEQKIEFK